jgi:hypothetical protein
LNQQVGRLLALENATVGWLRFASPKVDTASAAVFPFGFSSWFRDLWRRLDLVFPYTIFNLATALASVTEISGTRRGVPDTSEAPRRLTTVTSAVDYCHNDGDIISRNASGGGKLDLSAGDQIDCDRAGFIMRDSQEINHVGTNRKDRIVY